MVERNPPPGRRSKGTKNAYGVYNPVDGEEFFEDVEEALARAAFLSGINEGQLVYMRTYEGDGKGGWLWGKMWAVCMHGVFYDLPEGARAANPSPCKSCESTRRQNPKESTAAIKRRVLR